MTASGIHEPPPESYWQSTAQAPVLSHDLPSSAEVVVIGAGIVGAATAYWLARSGARPVLLERSVPAFGATGRNAGFMTTGPAEGYLGAITRVGHATARDIYQLTLENRSLLRELIAAEAINCDYREPGTLSLELSAEQFDAAGRSVDALSADGFPALLLNRDALQDLVATELGPEVHGGVLLPETGLVHSARLVYGLIDAAKRHGARLVQSTVSALEEQSTGVTLQTSRGPITAASVVVTTNAWTSDLLPSLTNLVVPVRGQMLAYAPIAPVFKQGMGADLSPTGEYWQQTPDGTIIIGGCRAFATNKDVNVREAQPTPEVQSALETILPRLFPKLNGLKIVQRWAGLMAFTQDYLPIAGQVPGMTRVWTAGGFCGHGMPFGIRFGQLLAQAAIEARPPDVLHPFRADRPTLQSYQDD